MRIILGSTAALMLAGCGGGGPTGGGASGNSLGAATAPSSAPVRAQPGSWSNRMQLVQLDMGPGVDSAQMRRVMQQAFDGAAARGFCLTPEAVARGNVAEQMAAQGKKCEFTRRVQEGERLDYAGTCTDQGGQRVRIAVTGTSGATAQDVTVKTEAVNPTGPGPRVVEMHIQMERKGECQPGDIRLPTQAGSPPAG